jgi:FkbM family methyltransferase
MSMSRAEIIANLETRYFSDEMDEAAELSAFPQQLTNVRVFFDIGAAIGQYTKVANEHLRSATIVAFEADPIRFEHLEENCRRWERQSTNFVRAVHTAVCDKDGEITFQVHEDSVRSGGLFIPGMPDTQTGANRDNWQTLSLQGVSLDTYCRANRLTPDLMKMDIEGAEYRALLGARSVLQRQQCRFLIEVHPWGDIPKEKKPADVFNLLAEYGYDFTRLERHWSFAKAKRPFLALLKNRGMRFVFRHPLLLRTLKHVMVRYILSKR